MRILVNTCMFYCILFVYFTLARWLFGHAPWSNAYEAIVYVLHDVFWFSI
jgi:hypothetical protein